MNAMCPAVAGMKCCQDKYSLDATEDSLDRTFPRPLGGDWTLTLGYFYVAIAIPKPARVSATVARSEPNAYTIAHAEPDTFALTFAGSVAVADSSTIAVHPASDSLGSR